MCMQGVLLTPANALPCFKNKQVADFNLSRADDAQGLSTVVVQNPRWLAPERLAGGAGGLPADVWAFGTVRLGLAEQSMGCTLIVACSGVQGGCSAVWLLASTSPA